MNPLFCATEIAKDELRPETSFDADGWFKTFESVVDKAKQLEAASVERIKVLEKELVDIQAEMVWENATTYTLFEELNCEDGSCTVCSPQVKQFCWVHYLTSYIVL